MADQNEALLRKVRALLNKAENPACTPAEAEAFSKKAEALIAKYAIDAALLAADGNHGDQKPTSRTVKMDKNYAKPKMQLLWGVVQGFDAKMIWLQREKAAAIVGYATDLDAIDLLFSSLLVQATNAMLADPIGKGCSGDELWRFRQSFLVGFGDVIYHRMRETRQRARREAVDGSQTKELALRDRSAHVRDTFAELFPNTSKVSGAKAHHSGGYRGGEAAAARADIGNTRVGARRQIA